MTRRPFGLQFEEVSPVLKRPEVLYEAVSGISWIETSAGTLPFVEWAGESLADTSTRLNDVDAPQPDLVTVTETVERSD